MLQQCECSVSPCWLSRLGVAKLLLRRTWFSRIAFECVRVTQLRSSQNYPDGVVRLRHKIPK